jgi:hypothetical protein
MAPRRLKFLPHRRALFRRGVVEIAQVGMSGFGRRKDELGEYGKPPNHGNTRPHFKVPIKTVMKAGLRGTVGNEAPIPTASTIFRCTQSVPAVWPTPQKTAWNAHFVALDPPKTVPFG